jgi:hypothetical protein
MSRCLAMGLCVTVYIIDFILTITSLIVLVVFADISYYIYFETKAIEYTNEIINSISGYYCFITQY